MSWERRNLPQSADKAGSETGLGSGHPQIPAGDWSREKAGDKEATGAMRLFQEAQSLSQAISPGDVLGSGVAVAQPRKEPQNKNPLVIVARAIKAH